MKSKYAKAKYPLRKVIAFHKSYNNRPSDMVLECGHIVTTNITPSSFRRVRCKMCYLDSIGE